MKKVKTIIIVFSQLIIIILIISLIIIYGFFRAAQRNLSEKTEELEKIKIEYNQIQEKIKINEKKLEKIKENEVKTNEKIYHIAWDNIDLSDDPIIRRAGN